MSAEDYTGYPTDGMTETVEGADGMEGSLVGIHDTRAHNIHLPNGRMASQFDPQFEVIRKLDGRVGWDSGADDGDDDDGMDYLNRANPHIV